MDVYTLDQLSLLKTPVVFLLGVFDGVHIGHQYLLSFARALSRTKGIPTAALAFTSSPRAIMGGNVGQSVLTTPTHKRELLETLGLSILIEAPFSPEIQAMSAERFLQLLESRCHIDTWVVGSDVGFGRGRSGNRVFLEGSVALREQSALFIERLSLEGENVSSTSVRKALFEGNIEKVSQLLARPYTFRSSIMNFEQTPYGYAFLHLERLNMCLPKEGIWKARIIGENGCALLYIKNDSCVLLSGVQGKKNREIEVMPEAYVRPAKEGWQELLAEEKVLFC